MGILTCSVALSRGRHFIPDPLGNGATVGSGTGAVVCRRSPSGHWVEEAPDAFSASRIADSDTRTRRFRKSTRPGSPRR